MKRSTLAMRLLALVGLFAFAGEKQPSATPKSGAATDAPRFTADNQLIRPDNYREWVYLSSGLGMSYSGEAGDASMGPMFDNVWVHPDAYRHFMATGTWPDKTIFVLEVRRSTSKASINKGGHFQGELVALEASVKDESRFPEKWAYFGFMNDGKLKDSTSAFPKAACYQCHTDNAAVDHTFVQFYPTLRPLAEAKGTYDKVKAEKH
ncbi:MAG: cytochrome P460 family protein [Acidobacteria bacterium]|nr:cytochrome P460 family protein [Acidobacteriota bacterium]